MTTATRAARMAMPLARDSIRKIAEASGGCLRPVQLRRTDTVTGQTEQVMIPCGATLASICPPCSERAKALRPPHAARTVIVSILLRMKPPGFQISAKPCASPPSLVQRTASFWSPGGKAGATASHARALSSSAAPS